MQNKLFKPHPIGMLWGETISLQFWTIPTHSVGMCELNDQKAISSSQVLISSVLPYELFLLKGNLCLFVYRNASGVHSERDSASHEGVRTVKHENACFLVWTQPIHQTKVPRQACCVLCFPSFSLVRPATITNDFAFGEKWKTSFLCQCTSARNYFTYVQLNQDN